MRFQVSLCMALAAAFSFALIAQDGFQRERGGKNDEAKNALEGKAPPKLEMANWMNTGEKALNWEGLKGSVVVIDFWAYW